MVDPYTTVQVTTQYSNAVLVALLPLIGDFAEALKLDVDVPIQVEQVDRFEPRVEKDNVGGVVFIKDHVFSFSKGHVDLYRRDYNKSEKTGDTVVAQQNGAPGLSNEECVAMARSAILRMGYELDELYANFVPSVERTSRHSIFGGFKVVEVSWLQPHMKDNISVTFAIQPYLEEFVEIWFSNYNLWRPGPEIGMENPVTEGPGLLGPKVEMDPEVEALQIQRDILEAQRILRMFHPVEKDPEAETLANYRYARIEGANQGWFEFKDGTRVHLRDGKFHIFMAPDRFFVIGKEVKASQFVGPHRYSKFRLLKEARKAVASLGFDQRRLKVRSPPVVQRPNMVGRITIPRYLFVWNDIRGGILYSSVTVEMDASDGSFKHIYVWDPVGEREVKRIGSNAEKGSLADDETALPEWP